MSRKKKILVYGGSALLVLLLALIILVRLLITPERIKGWALPLLEDTLQREVLLADVEIGLFSGIALHDLRIQDRDGKNTLLRIEDLVLSYRFRPLLSGRLVIDEIRLVGPSIRLVRHADGTMNIDDLLGSAAAEETAALPTAEPAADGTGIDLLVSRVLLEDGDLLLVNSADPAGNLHLQDIRLLATNISLEDAFPLELSARFNGTGFRVDGEFQPAAATGRLDLFVERLDLNQFLPAAAETAETPPRQSQQTGPPAAEPGPIEVPITLVGSVRIDELLYQQLTVQDIRAEYQLKDNHFQLQQLSGELFAGQFNLQSDVDLGKKGFAYQGDFSLDNVDLQSLVPALMPQAEKSSHGLLKLQLAFSGAGTDPERLLRQLDAKGSFQLAEGKLMGNPLLTELAAFLGNPQLKILSFQSLTGHYDLRQQLAQVKVALDSSKTRLDTSGTVHLDGQLALQLEARLAPEMLQGVNPDSPLRRALTDADGWAVLPLNIAGTYQDPKISLSGKALRSQAEQQLKQKLEEKVQEKVQEKLGGEGEPARKLLDDSLKKLFGK
jgi:uncharacterized protein involved in outer membrane biogenesis